MKTGKQIERDLCKAGINALWLSGRGMIIMSAYYGIDCAVQGRYPIYGRSAAASIIGMDAEERAAVLHDAPYRGTYEVR